MNELAQLTELCRRLGAEGPQADTMARQLIKRADQIARERGQDRAEAMAYLLKLVIEGRQGGVAKEFQPPSSPEGQKSTDSPSK